MNQYGIDINALEQFMKRPAEEKTTWGRLIQLAHPFSQYRLERYDISKAGSVNLSIPSAQETTIFVEEGLITAGSVILEAQRIFTVNPGSEIILEGKENSVVYTFSGAPEGNKYSIKREAEDRREKYWGRIETVVSKDYAGKRIFMRAGENSSLEFHCRKTESYFIHSGKLLVRLRAGRGEDRFFELNEGDALFTPPGLMHQRGGLKDTVIIEVSTRDEDSDSFLVEDGQKHKMPNL